MRKYTHINQSERRRIERLLSIGEGVNSISTKLGRSPNSISEEIKRNSVNDIYTASKAERKANVKRKQSKIQCMKVVMDKELQEYVNTNILNEQSPEGISTRLRCIEKDKQYVSTKGIYKYIHSIYGRKIERSLYSKRVKRKSGPKRNRGVSDNSKVSIEKRPKYIEKRKKFGHFEGDYIESGKDGKGSILVLMERKTRYVFLAYTDSKKTKDINQLISDTLYGVPIKSLTLDNDISFQKHEVLSQLISSTVYFTRPYTSQDKGSVENRNKSIRQHIPKRTNLSSIPEKEILRVQEWLRTRYMICLNGHTPQEIWDMEIQKNTPLGVNITSNYLKS